MPLMNKEYLESLGLRWGNEAADLIMNPALDANIARFQERKEHVPGPSGEPETHASDCDPVLAGEVLAGLQPHKNLKKMFIVGYPGIKFPHWVLPNLTEMVLINCRGCVRLPILGHLPFLRTLRMEGTDNIVHIGREFYSEDVVSFPSLQELFMRDFPSLQKWDCLNDREIFPLLSKLVIRKCPNLDSLPLFLSPKHLEMQKGFENLNALECFEICDCHTIETLPENPIGGLISLQVYSSLSSITVGLQYLTAIKHLTIMYCPNLAGLPDSLEHLSSLLSLAIINCPLIECLPNGLQHVKTLVRLEIRNCQRIADLPEWLDSLASLRTQAISECPNIKSLPVAFQRLIKLQHLSIQDCPDPKGVVREMQVKIGGKFLMYLINISSRLSSSNLGYQPLGLKSKFSCFTTLYVSYVPIVLECVSFIKYLKSFSVFTRGLFCKLRSVGFDVFLEMPGLLK
ncbi:putative disease resistance protein At3g14460 [Olea europaea var. sylvestris]|uniref:putative disease resistance protein At3g14460 n=1 Tax=Olea europaea var. sylvestris TaxID=158386 RepID=UPI000C1D0D57|nr:putative disease resistance protein At3g14460 [Olea europaea var. sylvestris]